MSDFTGLLNTSRLDDEDDDEDGDDEKKGAKGGEFLGKKLMDHRTILVAKPVDRDLMASITAQLLLLDSEDSKKPITMYINCPGGDADSGFAIYDCMRFITAPVHTVCMGLAASAAIIIFLGGKKGKRFATPHCRFLIHQPSSRAQGQASDLEITAREIIKTRDKYNAIIESETGVPADKIVTDAHRDFWLSATEAKAYKLCDKIVTARKDV